MSRVLGTFSGPVCPLRSQEDQRTKKKRRKRKSKVRKRMNSTVGNGALHVLVNTVVFASRYQDLKSSLRSLVSTIHGDIGRFFGVLGITDFLISDVTNYFVVSRNAYTSSPPLCRCSLLFACLCQPVLRVIRKAYSEREVEKYVGYIGPQRQLCPRSQIRTLSVENRLFVASLLFPIGSYLVRVEWLIQELTNNRMEVKKL